MKNCWLVLTKLNRRSPARSILAGSCFIVLLRFVAPAHAGEQSASPIHVGDKFDAIDTFSCGDESSAEAKEYLATLSWKPSKFTVQIEAADSNDADYLVRFPSARPIG